MAVMLGNILLSVLLELPFCVYLINFLGLWIIQSGEGGFWKQMQLGELMNMTLK